MRKNKILLAVVLLVSICIISSCKDDDQDNKPAEKKKHAWVAGVQDSSGYGLLLYTPDGGKTWSQKGASSDALKNIDLLDIWAVDETNIWACGTNNSIVKSSDGGDTWALIQPDNPTNADLNRISINQNNIWVCGENATVYQSKDAGENWLMHDSENFKNAFFQGIEAMNENKIFAVGQHPVSLRGFIAYSNNGGESWDTITPADNFNKWQWIGVTSYNNTVVIYGAKAHYMLSSDGGNTWINDSVPGASGGGGQADLNDLIMLDEETWWGAFDMGNIFITQNGGKTWLKQDAPTIYGSTFLLGIDCWNKNDALIVGTGTSFPQISPVLTTDDGGFSTWQKSYEIERQLWKVSVIRGNQR